MVGPFALSQLAPLRPLLYRLQQGLCADAGGGGGRRIQSASRASRNAVGFAPSDTGVAALSVRGARFSSGRSDYALSNLLPRLGPSNAGLNLARAVAPGLADAVLPALSTLFDCAGLNSGDVGSFAPADELRFATPFAVCSPGDAVQHSAPDFCADSGRYTYAPSVGRAARTAPFVGMFVGSWFGSSSREQPQFPSLLSLYANDTLYSFLSASLGLPTEILLSIFAYAAGPYIDTEPHRHSYYQSIFAIAGACRHWHDFVGSCGSLWSSFCLAPHRLAASLDFWLSRVHRAPLDLRLSFDDLFALYHPPSTARAPRLGTRGTIHRVAPALSRCARLSIDAETTIAFPLLMCILGVADGHLLVSLSITRVYFAFLEDLVPPLDPAPNLFFKTGVPMLRFLRLCNATVGWDNLQFYLRLQVLKLWGIRRPINPTAVQLYYMLAAASCLIRLSLREVECDALPTREHAFFSWPYLVELDLHLSGTLGIPDVLSRCRMPALRKLTLVLDTKFDLRCLLACSAMLGHVVVLSLQVDGVSREVLSDLWGSLPLVEELDVSYSGLAAFEALYSPDGPCDGSHLCPRLSTLVVRSVPPIAMKQFLQRRFAAGFILRRLVMYQVVDFFEDGEADLTWIADLLGVGAFLMDPDRHPDSSMDWLNH
ncbi:hypothetical protein C8F04DRAFT_1250194 [Mycena alexandri]|uniref:F-box domain-containing protein n=1 Tax=Mycena alexandri TaxID=1745969 RepID=A0AAD6TD55_9AGAR|nr:hypothetical protein C8F04DRAFT_1250194 [Mycena alexandri]